MSLTLARLKMASTRPGSRVWPRLSFVVTPMSWVAEEPAASLATSAHFLVPALMSVT